MPVIDHIPGDGQTGPVPALPEARSDAARPDVSGDARLAALAALLAEARRQSEILTEIRDGQAAMRQEHGRLLHRVVLGDVDLLDADDLRLALGVGRTKLAELLADGEIPHTRIGSADKGRVRTTRDALRATIRNWMSR